MMRHFDVTYRLVGAGNRVHHLPVDTPERCTKKMALRLVSQSRGVNPKLIKIKKIEEKLHADS